MANIPKELNIDDEGDVAPIGPYALPAVFGFMGREGEEGYSQIENGQIEDGQVSTMNVPNIPKVPHGTYYTINPYEMPAIYGFMGGVDNNQNQNQSQSQSQNTERLETMTCGKCRELKLERLMTMSLDEKIQAYRNGYTLEGSRLSSNQVGQVGQGVESLLGSPEAAARQIYYGFTTSETPAINAREIYYGFMSERVIPFRQLMTMSLDQQIQAFREGYRLSDKVDS